MYVCMCAYVTCMYVAMYACMYVCVYIKYELLQQYLIVLAEMKPLNHLKYHILQNIKILRFPYTLIS